MHAFFRGCVQYTVHIFARTFHLLANRAMAWCATSKDKLCQAECVNQLLNQVYFGDGVLKLRLIEWLGRKEYLSFSSTA